MPLESTIINSATDVTKKAVQVVNTGIKKAWSILEAASEKKHPSELLSQNAIQTIQGTVQPKGS